VGRPEGRPHVGSAAADRGIGADLTVEAHDIEFDRDAYRVTSGPVDIDYQREVLSHGPARRRRGRTRPVTG
jgi:hypothetical protein